MVNFSFGYEFTFWQEAFVTHPKSASGSWTPPVLEGRKNVLSGMNRMNGDDPEMDQVTRLIIGCAFAVANGLGAGFLEKVYENALAYKLRHAGLAVDQQRAVDVLFEGRRVGTYVADLIVQNAVLLELNAATALSPIHVAQCLNLLKASRLQICLLLNFGTPRLQICRLTRPT